MSKGLSRSWRMRILREKLFMRQGGFCYYCLGPMLMSVPINHHQRATLDHRRAKSRRGTDQQDNLVLACRPCNKRKGSMPEALFRKMEHARHQQTRR